MNKKCFLIILITFLSISLFCEKIKVRVTNYPPQYFRDANGKWTGIDIELAEAIILKAGYTPEFVELPWSRALKDIEEGNIDMMMNLSKTDERSNFLNWIGPERHSKMIIVVNKVNTNMKINKIDDLVILAKKMNINFGIQSDAFYSEDFNEILKDPIFKPYFETVPKSETNYRKLKSKRLLGFFEEALTATDQIKNNPDYNEFCIHSFQISSDPVYFGISKKLSTLNYEKLKKAFDQLEKSGELKKIRDKYYKL